MTTDDRPRVEVLGSGGRCEICGEHVERGLFRGREIQMHSRGYCPGAARGREDEQEEDEEHDYGS